MTAPQNFRSAFNGFNREDVVNYIAYITNKHETLVNQLNSDLAQAKEMCADFAEKRRQETESAEELEKLRQEVSRMKQEIFEKDEKIQQLNQKIAEQKSVQPVQVKPDPARVSEELSAYRRAESMERRAREQVNQMYDKACGTLADVSVNLEQTTEKITLLEENLTQNLVELQEAISESKTRLADTAVAIAAIRPEQNT